MAFRIGSLSLKIRSMRVSAYEIPASSRESDGTLEWDGTTLITVELEADGKKGQGCSYGNAAAAFLSDRLLRRQVEGFGALDVEMIWNGMAESVRNTGRPGIASMAISAVDTALWDLKAKILGVPLVKLLGPVREGIMLYGSGGFTSYSIRELEEHFSNWKEQGFQAVKMKVGRKPEEDPRRVKAVRKVIGPETRLFVDANGAYSCSQAAEYAAIYHDSRVTWFEEPVSSDDLKGLRWVRKKNPPGMAVAAGEYGYVLQDFRRMLEAGAVDVLQADATRCGGITGFMKTAHLCEAFGVPLSAHTAPSVHLHAVCALKPACHLEYFYDHVRIEQKYFDGAAKPVDGFLYPDLTRPGLGIEFKVQDLARYRVYP